MKFLITSMTGNRLFSKALRRLHPRLKDLESRYTYLSLKDETFENIFIFFVDRSLDFEPHSDIKDRDYSVEIAVPLMESYKSDHDHELLLKIADQVRGVLEKSSMNFQNKNEVLRRFSEWESAIRKETFRVIETHSPD